MDVKTLILVGHQGEEEMKSKKPIVLHDLLGKPIISYSVQASKEISSKQICLVKKDQLEEIKGFIGDQVDYVLHEDGLIKALEFAQDSEDVMIMNGDAPLIRKESLKSLVKIHREEKNRATILGPIFLGQDLDQIYIFKAGILKAALQRRENQEDECCLESVMNLLVKDGSAIGIVNEGVVGELGRIRSRRDLADASLVMRNRVNQKHMKNGVTLEDYTNTYIEPDVIIGQDTILEQNCILKGKTIIGEDCFIGNNSKIIDSQISSGVKIEHSQVDESFIDSDAHIGPFAYIRPGSHIGKGVRIGDFVEIKNSYIGDYSKVSHLTYVGDADVGEHVNFGCGSVLVNYDSVHKHRSKIEDYAFIGCNTNLVSPVNIGKRAYTAAGSTITVDVPEESLGISRVKQVNKEGWVAHKYPKS